LRIGGLEKALISEQRRNDEMLNVLRLEKERAENEFS
jgi:hypothetical protein